MQQPNCTAKRWFRFHLVFIPKPAPHHFWCILVCYANNDETRPPGADRAETPVGSIKHKGEAESEHTQKNNNDNNEPTDRERQHTQNASFTVPDGIRTDAALNLDQLIMRPVTRF